MIPVETDKYYCISYFINRLNFNLNFVNFLQYLGIHVMISVDTLRKRGIPLNRTQTEEIYPKWYDDLQRLLGAFENSDKPCT